MRLPIALFAVLSSACGPLVSAELEAPETCADLEPVAVPASPIAVDGAINLKLPLELPEEVAAVGEQSDAEVELLRVELRVDGVPDLGFMDAVTIRAQDAAGASTLAEYVRTEAAPRAVTLAPAARLDLARRLTQGGVETEAGIEGTLPTVSWTLRARACFAARARLEWSPR